MYENSTKQCQAHYFFPPFPLSSLVTATEFSTVCAVINEPNPSATLPSACAVVLARNAPAAPAETAGMAGIEPSVIRMAPTTDIVRGYSDVRFSRDTQVWRSQSGTSARRCIASAVSCTQYRKGNVMKWGRGRTILVQTRNVETLARERFHRVVYGLRAHLRVSDGRGCGLRVCGLLQHMYYRRIIVNRLLALRKCAHREREAALARQYRVIHGLSCGLHSGSSVRFGRDRVLEGSTDERLSLRARACGCGANGWHRHRRRRLCLVLLLDLRPEVGHDPPPPPNHNLVLRVDVPCKTNMILSATCATCTRARHTDIGAYASPCGTSPSSS